LKRYYIGEKNSNVFNALNKARIDIELSFENKEYKKIDILTKSNFSILSSIKNILNLIIKLNSKDMIFFQYPYYGKRAYILNILKILKKIKSNKIIAVIHDLDSLRYKKDKCYIEDEIRYLNLCDCVISHNEKMTEWLELNGLITNIININLFDYILDSKIKNNNLRKTDIVFAGNLDEKKSGFVYKLINNDLLKCKMNLYGGNFTGKISNPNIKYLGKYPPDELIQHIDGKFGLIWDGNSIERCDGAIGEYTKYNNPHKLSMYIAAGLPVICWKKMAIADFVEKNGIGICIDNLSEINNIINDIIIDDYNKILNNVTRLQSKLIRGNFTENALEEAERKVNLQ